MSSLACPRVVTTVPVSFHLTPDPNVVISTWFRTLMPSPAAGFLLSRSAGLPGFHPSGWEPSGLVSVLLEVGLVGALAWHVRGGAVRTNPRAIVG
jgi:hypothetical protein